MKKLRIYCILLLNLVAMTAVAQTAPFVEEGKTWLVESFKWPEISNLSRLTMEGDTLIAGRTWKKVYCTGNGKHRLSTALYEEDGRVYYLPYAGATEGRLLYDFTMKEGDEGIFFNPFDWERLRKEDEQDTDFLLLVKVTGTGKQTYGDAERKVLSATVSVYEIDGYVPVPLNLSWIEGVGNVYHPFNYVTSGFCGGPIYGLYECRVGNRILFETTRCSARPFVEEGKTWRMESRTAYDMLFNTDAPSTFQRYVIEGDTVIEKRKWKKLYLIQEETGQKTLLSALHETDDSNARVYFLQFAGDATGQLLYDFRLRVGDQCKYYNLSIYDKFPMKENYISEAIQFPISDTYVLETNGYLLQVFNTSEGSEYDPGLGYVEGVGNVIDPFRYIHYLRIGSDATHVVECSVGNNVLYKAGLWKDPAVGIENVRTEGSKANDGAVYDLSGRRLNGVPKSGMYIRNGRKYLVR